MGWFACLMILGAFVFGTLVGVLVALYLYVRYRSIRKVLYTIANEARIIFEE